MMFTWIVITSTLIALAFILLWLLRPEFRTWVEAPKYRFLEQESRFADDAARKANL